ncbi:MAG: multidrug ABC transporter ATP-binding protein [Candidatus Methanomethylicota archaeon]|nr:MAG: multidrug ABC transporter ATP-binding protein [Candidatus Verstraetearchaeota archaeon]
MRSTSNLAVEVDNLKKYYGRIKALDGLNFKVYEREIYGLIGPNGAGKTTTLRIIATLLQPTSGHVYVFGHDVVEEAAEVRKIISYLPEEAGAYKNLSGLEYLHFMASFYSKSKDELKIMVEEAVKISGLNERLKDKVKTYSKGMKRRLLIARTLMVHPKLAILDEPTSGLDVIHAYYLRRIIKEYVKTYGVTVLLSSHNMLEVEYLCDRVALIHKGKLVLEGFPSELKSKYEASNLEEVFAKVTQIV